MSLDQMINKVTTKTKSMQPLREIVLEFLREAIFSGHYKPGDHLVERELSTLLGISTTPIKEALRILGHEGLVETIPRKGTFVSELINTSIEELMMLKATLEGLASKLAAEKATDDEIRLFEKQIDKMKQLTKVKDKEKLVHENFMFHMLIRETAKSPLLLQTVNHVRAFDNAFRNRSLQYNVEVEEGYREHKAILQTIKKRKPELAKKLMEKHIMRTVEDVLDKEKE